MFDVSDSYLDAFKAPARQITGSVICSTDNGDIDILPDDNLISFKIEKTAPKGKLFGFAVSQKITIEALGILNTIKKGNRLTATIESKDYNAELVDLPYFYVDTIEVNKAKNTTTITGYDILHRADNINIGSLTFDYPMYVSAYARQLIESVGGYGVFEGIDFLMTETPNLAGNETVRSVISSLAEFTGTICYVQYQDTVRFRNMVGEDFTDVLTADDYYNLSVGEVTTITKVASATELGDNVESGVDGYTYVLWENPFLVNRDDVAADLETIANKVRNLMSTDYNLEWRGCPAYELGDLVILQEKDGTAQYARYFNETLEYNGGLRATSEWAAEESGNVDAAPTSMGQVLKQTYAKVDKANQKIELVAAEVAKIQLDENGIIASVNDELEKLETRITQTTDSISSTVSQQEKTITEIKQDLDGISLTYDSENGTASITIGDVTVSELVDGEYVDKTIAGITMDGYVTFNDLEQSGSTTINGSNITTGTISADRINMTGAIAWSDLTSGCQNTIESMVSDVSLPSYIKSTYIDATTVQSPTIIGGSLTSTSGTKVATLSDSKLTFRCEGSYNYDVGYIQAYDDGAGTAQSAGHGLLIQGSWNGDGYNGGIKIQSSDYAGVSIAAGTDVYFYNANNPNGIALQTIIDGSGGGTAVFG